jgi:hypothetical protein
MNEKIRMLEINTNHELSGRASVIRRSQARPAVVYYFPEKTECTPA